MDDAHLDLLGQQAYAAYGEQVGFKNFQGNPMPEWADLTEIIQDAWRAAAGKSYNTGYEDGRRALGWHE